MQDQKMTVNCVLIGVPADVLEEAGIRANDLLEITAEKGKISITVVDHEDIGDYVCDGDCDHCPVNQTDCDGNCADCPCRGQCE